MTFHHDEQASTVLLRHLLLPALQNTTSIHELANQVNAINGLNGLLSSLLRTWIKSHGYVTSGPLRVEFIQPPSSRDDHTLLCGGDERESLISGLRRETGVYLTIAEER